jgi:hypothetical protein
LKIWVSSCIAFVFSRLRNCSLAPGDESGLIEVNKLGDGRISGFDQGRCNQAYLYLRPRKGAGG